MKLSLQDFGTGGGTHIVEIENMTDGDLIAIKAMFIPTINDSTIKSRDAIDHAFRFAMQRCPDANPSDVWHHVLYRDYKRAKIGSSPEQSWVRTSGEALELSLSHRYNPILSKMGLRLVPLISGKEKQSALARMGLGGQIGSSKVDIIIEKQGKGAGLRNGYGIVGGIHVKASLAERVSDDIPASKIMMAAGFSSILATLDVKSFPPPHGDLVNRGELGTVANPSDKRKYIEEHGDFSCCISYNLRTNPSPAVTISGKKIYLGNMGAGEDDLVRFLDGAI